MSREEGGGTHARGRDLSTFVSVRALAIPCPSYARAERSIPLLPVLFPFLLWCVNLLHIALALEVLALDQVRYLVIVIVLLAAFLALAALLQALVALGQLPQAGERVGAELVQDAGDQLRELLVLAVAVNGEGV